MYHTSYSTIADRLVKLFLSSVDTLDAGLRSPTEKPVWLSKYNFPCLLNLPHMMALFGMPRNLWEGGKQGEGILRDVKPLISGLHGRWAQAAHIHYAASQSLKKVTASYDTYVSNMTSSALQCIINNHELVDEDVSEDFDLTTDADDGYRLGDYRRYRSWARCNSSFLANSPMSCVLLSDNNIYCVMVGGLYFNLEAETKVSMDVCCGLPYFNWKLSIAPTKPPTNSTVLDYCLFLPRHFGVHQEGLSPYREYAVITKSWKELKKDFTFGYSMGMCEVDLLNSVHK